MPFRKSPGDEEQFKFDQFAHATTVIQEQHRVSHDGFMHHVSDIIAALGNGASYDLLLAVPAAVYPHFQFLKFSLADSPCDLVVYEGTTTTDDGTVVTSFNLNRNSDLTPGLVISHTPTVSAVGTLVHERFVPDQGGQGSNDVGTISSTTGEEWILAPSTKYLVRLTNNSGGDIKFSHEALWYELDYEA